ncbi:MAG: hypothetical protein K2G53_02115 [Muribaculaceae bacterium]|nr:hypothetical protein [Muribaculaceae bacterium]
MNWGWGGLYNGWFTDANIVTPNGNFRYNRKELYFK